MPEINYRDLLVKYIRHVRNCEGVEFITEGGLDYEDLFSDEELALLKELAAEARQE